MTLIPCLMFMAGCGREKENTSSPLPEFAKFHPISEVTLDSMMKALDPEITGLSELDSAYIGKGSPKELTATTICRARYAYSQELCVEYDWLWHSRMMEYNPDLDSIKRDEDMNTYDNQPGMNHMAFVSATFAWLRLMDKLKEAIELSEEDWMKEAYMQDYRLWLELENDLFAMNVGNYSAWPQEAYYVSCWMANLRRELLEEEIGYLKESGFCYWGASQHLFCFDCSDRVLEKWYNSRMDVADKFDKDYNASAFRQMTNKIAYKFKKQKLDLLWYNRYSTDNDDEP